MIFTGNILKMAEKELIKVGKDYTLLDILNCSVKIGKWIDRHPKASKVILEGKKIKTKQEKYYFKKKYHITL